MWNEQPTIKILSRNSLVIFLRDRRKQRMDFGFTFRKTLLRFFRNASRRSVRQRDRKVDFDRFGFREARTSPTYLPLSFATTSKYHKHIRCSIRVRKRVARASRIAARCTHPLAPSTDRWSIDRANDPPRVVPGQYHRERDLSPDMLSRSASVYTSPLSALVRTRCRVCAHHRPL